jgi:pimeloyl-ACP methyl ester carboxylesterase
MPLSITDLPALDNRRVKTSTADVLVDRVIPGEILVIAFGFVSWETRPDFDFYGRLRKLEQNSGRHINKILVRDSGNAWYHRRIDGLGTHPDETAQACRALIREIRPSKVITIGQSMGAYAAVMYGLLLEVQQVIAFGPCPSSIRSKPCCITTAAGCPSCATWPPIRRPRATTTYRRWAAPRPARCPTCTSSSAPSRTRPAKNQSTSTPCTQAGGHRQLHAASVSLLRPHCGPAPDRHQAHQCTAGPTHHEPRTGRSRLEVTADWHSWIAENLRLGSLPEELVEILEHHGFSHASSIVAVAGK